MYHLPGCIQLRPVDSPEQTYTLRIRGMCTSSYRGGQQLGVWLARWECGVGSWAAWRGTRSQGERDLHPQLSLHVEMLCDEDCVWFTQRVYMAYNPKQS